MNGRQLWKFFFMKAEMWVFIISLPFFFYYYGPIELLVRVTLVFSVWSAVEARRCEWLTDQRSVHVQCVLIIAISLALTFAMAMVDLLTVVATVQSWNLITHCQIPQSQLEMSYIGISVVLFFEFLYVLTSLSSLHDIPQASAWLSLTGLDIGSIKSFCAKLQKLVMLPVTLCCSWQWPSTLARSAQQSNISSVAGLNSDMDSSSSAATPQLSVIQAVRGRTTGSALSQYRPLPDDDSDSLVSDSGPISPNMGISDSNSLSPRTAATVNNSSTKKDARAAAAAAALARAKRDSGNYNDKEDKQFALL